MYQPPLCKGCPSKATDLEPETTPASPQRQSRPAQSQWQVEVKELRTRIRELEIRLDNMTKKKGKYEVYK